MTTPAVQAIGMVWYEAEDFLQIKAMMKDGHLLHASHAEWLAAAEKGAQSFQTKGVRVYRALLRPAAFKLWCSTRGKELDAKARNEFATDFAQTEYSAGR